MWTVLWKPLQLRPYRLQFLQALKPTHSVRANFATDILMHDYEDFLDHVAFSYVSSFHLSGTVNTHRVHQRSENLHEMIQFQRDSPKLIVSCDIFRWKVYGPSLSMKRQQLVFLI